MRNSVVIGLASGTGGRQAGWGKALNGWLLLFCNDDVRGTGVGRGGGERGRVMFVFGDGGGGGGVCGR